MRFNPDSPAERSRRRNPRRSCCRWAKRTGLYFAGLRRKNDPRWIHTGGIWGRRGTIGGYWGGYSSLSSSPTHKALPGKVENLTPLARHKVPPRESVKSTPAAFRGAVPARMAATIAAVVMILLSLRMVKSSCNRWFCSACVALYRAACRGYMIARYRASCQALYRAIYFLHKSCTVLLCKMALYRVTARMLYYIYK